MPLIFEQFLRFLFPRHYKIKDIYAQKERDFLEKFPCPHCRPDGCTFYYDIPCHCNECGRNYSI